MIEWWNALSLPGQIYAIIAIAATLLLLIQVILLLIGFGDESDFGGDLPDGDIDMDIDGDVDADLNTDVVDGGLRVLSVRGVVSFFAVAGWVGVLVDKAGGGLWLSVPLSFVCGLATMILVALLMKWVMGLQSDGTADIRNALGVSGTVYLRVPANRKETGKVNLMLQGSYRELEAVTDEGEDLAYGTSIVVVGITGGNTLVVKKKQ